MSENEKTKGQLLYEQLRYQKKSGFELMPKDELDGAMDYAKGYMAYLDEAKTEREAVTAAIALLDKAGFSEYRVGDKLEKGGNYYCNNRGKALIVFRVGTEDINTGIRISAAHCDAPRLDLKQHPLFEETGFGYLKTHYYGGVRKYQWATIPLALHGVVTLADGTTKDVRIGDEPGDPVFVITDLLPHLAKDQNQKPLGTAFPAETLNVMIAASPYREEDGTVTPSEDKVKLTVLSILNEKYGMTEADFVSAELCAVPAANAVDIGLDRWLIGSYGHDDRVCLYPALTAMIDNKDTAHSLMCILADKEEIGSEGVSGMQCRIFTDIIDEMASQLGGNANVIRANSICVSADVTAAYDPNYSDVFEKRNSAIVSSGVALSKYTGSGGKSSTNDASAEFVGRIRRIFDGASVVWQTAELGKVDQGGGGTVAKYIAKCNIDTVDIGVPVLSMHAPFEVVSKIDVYAAYKGFSAFYKAD
ncbi:MAG: aminopeptidase [Clostridia bacterium]|nr:aminopeptidase [Clostridia bacterium]